jgi:hypothetical protein
LLGKWPLTFVSIIYKEWPCVNYLFGTFLIRKVWRYQRGS